MFVLVRGNVQVAKQEYSYARRAQSVTMTLCWKDVATIPTDELEEAITESVTAIKEWRDQGYKCDRWVLEGRGKNIQVRVDLADHLADR